MTNVTVVVGAQYGSEGKGAVCGFLGKKMEAQDLAIRVAGPNAGHTAYDADHREWKLRAVPVAAATSMECGLHIAAGSEIDLEVLTRELADLDEAGFRASDRLSIHPSATILEPKHASSEQTLGLVSRIGSTGKGIGAARAARIMREASTAQSIPMLERFIRTLDYKQARNIVIEGTQGYGLGLHTEFYPQVTSSDCRAIDFLAMCGLSPWAEDMYLDVILVARVHPIRVAGNSGPLKDETSWSELGLNEEYTTVTHKVRRVGEWDHALVVAAIEANGGGDFHPNVRLALTMVDQLYPEVYGKTELTDEADSYVTRMEDLLECSIGLAGTGPETMVVL